MPGVRLRVRGLGNADYRRLQSRFVNDVPFRERRKALDPQAQDCIQAECLAKTVLLDWEGIKDDGGEPIPYSIEKAGAILSDPDLAMFREAVVYVASHLVDDEQEAVENLAGN